MLKPNNNSSMSESSESKSENFFSFNLVCLSDIAIAAVAATVFLVLSDKPVTDDGDDEGAVVILGGETTEAVTGEGA